MGLIDGKVIDDMLQSSSISKGIERTMEHMINELDIESMYILHCARGVFPPEADYEWEQSDIKNRFSLEEYVDNIEEWCHFEEDDMFVARATSVLSMKERIAYQKYGYEACVEYQVRNHGNPVGYIIIGWDYIKEISDEEENEIHVLLKLLNELLIAQFNREVVGGSDWKLFQLSNEMTKTLLYMIDEDYRLHYVNAYAREQYPSITPGEYCYKALQGRSAPCKDCFIRTMDNDEIVNDVKYVPYLEGTFYVNAGKVQIQENKPGYAITLQKKEGKDGSVAERGQSGQKFIFALKAIYKDLIAVDIRKDVFYNLLEEEEDNRHSYSMDFVLKWFPKIHADDKQQFLECFDISFLQNDYMNGVKNKELDFHYRTHEGSYHCMNAQIIFDENVNKDVMVYILFRDIEQKRSARLDEKKQLRDSLMAARSSAELKGEVLANISREIRNPMNGITSMASVAKQVYKDEEKLLDCLDNIDRYAGHMMRTMDSLLQMVNVNNDKIVIVDSPFQLDSFLNRIDLGVRESVEKKNVQFYVSSKCQYQKLLGDEVRLYQAVIGLIQNAVSYTPISGEIRLSANQVAADTKTVYIRFMIDDTGNGLTEKMKESIFGFTHDDEHGEIEEEHFNLSLAAQIIRLMGGDIGVNVDDSGTHLNFTLPFKLQDTTEERSVKKKITTPSAGEFSGKRILLAEDTEMNRDAIRAVLEVVGFTVDEVDNGKKAVVQYVSKPSGTYDAVLMDVHMPIMDGREATRCIRISGKEDGEEIPIIGMMSNTLDEDIEESLASGMQAHLGKPVDVDRLYKVLKKVIG